MSEGKGYYLHVKHAVQETWKMVGPDPRRFGLFQIEDSVKEMAELFNSLGLTTRIEEITVEYDDR